MSEYLPKPGEFCWGYNKTQNTGKRSVSLYKCETLRASLVNAERPFYVLIATLRMHRENGRTYWSTDEPPVKCEKLDDACATLWATLRLQGGVIHRRVDWSATDNIFKPLDWKIHDPS